MADVTGREQRRGGVQMLICEGDDLEPCHAA